MWSEIGDKSSVGACGLHEIAGLPQTGIFDGGSNVEHVEAFGDDDGVEVNVTASQAAVDLGRIGIMLE